MSRAQFDTNGGCWLFDGHWGRGGYGQFYIVRGTPLHAHRVSWMLHNGPIPPGAHVLHKCDVPPCFRPDHLFLGTPFDNVHDCMAKGRKTAPPHLQGSGHGSARLSDAEVLEIRARWADGGISQTALGLIYGVNQTTISAIVHRKLWAHI